MSIIWYTLYILGAISIVLLWVQIMALIGTACKVIRDKEWAQVKVVEGPPGPKGDRGTYPHGGGRTPHQVQRDC